MDNGNKSNERYKLEMKRVNRRQLVNCQFVGVGLVPFCVLTIYDFPLFIFYYKYIG